MQVGIIHDLIGGGTAAGNIIMIALPKLVFCQCLPDVVGNTLRMQMREVALYPALAGPGSLVPNEPNSNAIRL